VTTVGRVVAEELPAEAAALKQITPGTKIIRINGDTVASWDAVVSGIANAPAAEVRIELDRGGTVVLPIHPDAVEQRLKAAQALQPFRAPVIGEVLPDKPAARVGIEEGDTVVAVNGRPVGQWYDLLEVLQGGAGQNVALTVARGGERLDFDIRPYTDTIPGPNGKPRVVGRIGVAVGARADGPPLAPRIKSSGLCGAFSVAGFPGARLEAPF
jgi:regulator of sigma E protease